GVGVAGWPTANSDLSSRATSTPVRNFPLYVPKGGGQTLIAELSASTTDTVDSTELPRVAEQPPEVEIAPTTDQLRPAGRQIEVIARAGDTLRGIAATHGVSVEDLKRWNPVLRNRVLYRGDRLTVYSESTATTVYRVQPGDTLSTIAERYDVRVRELMAWNGLRSANRIRVGQELEIRGDGGVAEIVYTVQRGNNLQAIAEIFSVRYRDIMAWNNLSSSRLRAGQRLTIRPSSSVEVVRHRVLRGENVGRIARKYGVSVSSIVIANGLGRRGLIQPGQTLTVYIVS
ncbi:MAG: LysM peptidoglycan-binding domain-containing protein, partial [Acidobacteriota bacterium]